jgi:hypothetical protein
VAVRVRYDTDGADVLARCALEGSRTLVGHDMPEVTVHFTGTVRLSASRAEGQPARPVPARGEDEAVVSAEAIYATYFHGPAYRVLSEAWRAEGGVAGRLSGGLPANHVPADRPTVVTPRLIELAFQTAGLAEIAASGRLGLPLGLSRLEVPGAEGGEVESVALTRSAPEGAFDVDVVDAEGRVVLSLRGYRTATLPGTVAGDAFAGLKG